MHNAMKPIDNSANAAHFERQAVIWDMTADNLPLGDPSIPGCRAEADKARAMAQRYRSESDA